jgi:hypothetical protein
LRAVLYFRSLLSTLFERKKIEGEPDEELRAHIQQQADDFERSDLPCPEAERQAQSNSGALSPRGLEAIF